MKYLSKTKLTALLLLMVLGLQAQEDDSNYITFNDRRNIVHGIYLGLALGYGEVEGKGTSLGQLKLAYVANQEFEAGLAINVLYSEQDVFNPRTETTDDLFAAYAGLHFEHILFGQSRVNLSFPLFVGAGVAGYVDRELVRNDEDIELENEDVDPIFVVEPGVNALFNISRYVQLEAGIRYRFSSKINLEDSPIDRINGFGGVVGIKVGVFNLGRNRYKKQLD
ncbi:MAG: hypothetical protein AAGF77_07925 [Bacteroidota bacterium]